MLTSRLSPLLPRHLQDERSLLTGSNDLLPSSSSIHAFVSGNPNLSPPLTRHQIYGGLYSQMIVGESFEEVANTTAGMASDSFGAPPFRSFRLRRYLGVC